MKVIHLIEDVVSNIEKQEVMLRGIPQKGKTEELVKLDKKYHAMMNKLRDEGYDDICRDYMTDVATKQSLRSKYNLSMREYNALCKADESIRAIELELDGKEINFIYVD